MEIRCEKCNACVDKLSIYKFKFLDVVGYNCVGETYEIEKSLCLDCYYKLSTEILPIIYGTNKWLEEN